jgi:hypothetical protein
MGLRMQPRSEMFFTLISKAGRTSSRAPPVSRSSSPRRTSDGRSDQYMGTMRRMSMKQVPGGQQSGASSITRYSA